MMKKLLIVPVVLAMASLSGSAFAQRGTGNNVGNGSGTTANNSRAFALGSPSIQTNVAVPVNVAVGNNNGQANGVGQSNTTSIGFGGPQSGAISGR